MASSLYGVRVGDDDDALTAQVGEANRAFYRAFADGDLAAMDAVWAHGPHVRCVHPGWPALEGWARVRASWARILGGPDVDMEIVVEGVQIRAGRDVAWVACVERLRGVDADTAVLATNVFERDDGGAWRMVQHHASPILTREGLREPGSRDGSPPGDHDVN